MMKKSMEFAHWRHKYLQNPNENKITVPSPIVSFMATH